ncbi:DUF3667 domain-containing protein [Pontibacter sp. Tf4]|uniref:DUF3667 domain-containing protein n=1 Tax=Pontibacter sp. Tf4 TaxID=2761620 RepID=UPI00162898FF|nr:DUF3667 domain-containing protein [Pontibacter sp. Tf4]MBB6612805.1 DUF3667 domain-containing protein [Pontibacter sp. Tf4]
MKKHYRSENDCLNCGNTVPDKFCTNCGQENLQLHESFLHLMLHSVGHYFHVESKFFNSLVPLFTKPGFLTKEYFAGRRASYLNPFSMYISISILFFFLFTANTNINQKKILKEKAGAGKTIVTERPEEKIPVKDNISINGWDVPIKGLNAKFREVKQDELRSALFKNKLVSHLPKTMFLLLPLFALILKLVNIRSKKLYAEHLIYSIHVHSFLFLFGAILIALKWLLPFLSSWILLAGFIVSVWYIYRSMRTMYRSSRWRTVSKFMMLAFAYTFLMLLSCFGLVLITLYSV